MTKHMYAGIGPRNTKMGILGVMNSFGREMQELHWFLRSGHGAGADQAFARDVDGANKEIWVPKPGFNGATEDPWFKCDHSSLNVRRIAARNHGGYDKCTRFVQTLFERNVQILLGEYADHPVDMVVYWHKAENRIDSAGGTNHSLRVAREFNIPCFNIEFGDHRKAIEKFILEKAS